MLLKDVQCKEDDQEMTVSSEVQRVVTQIKVNYA